MAKQTPPGFVAGGSFSVSWPPGTPAEVRFWATRGERIIVETPAQRAEREKEPPK